MRKTKQKLVGQILGCSVFPKLIALLCILSFCIGMLISWYRRLRLYWKYYAPNWHSKLYLCKFFSKCITKCHISLNRFVKIMEAFKRTFSSFTWFGHCQHFMNKQCQNVFMQICTSSEHIHAKSYNLWTNVSSLISRTQTLRLVSHFRLWYILNF